MAHTATSFATPVAPGCAVAYLVSHYPAVSHAFIEREVLALRALGVDVHTFSVRPAISSELLSETMRAEARRTTALLGLPVREHLRVQVALLAGRPGAWGRALKQALSSGPRAARAQLWQVFYFVEAATLHAELERRGLRHLHVHFANNGADVARLVVALGVATDGPAAGWRWTFSMHGPTEFADPVGFDLPAKTRSADRVACISDYCREELGRLVEPAHHQKLGLVRMGVDVQRFEPASQERASRTPGPLRLLFVGRLVAEKGPSDLLSAVALVHAAGQPLDVVVIGDGPLKEELAAQVAAAGLGDIVRLLGARGQDELPDHYRWADVFCLPSYQEGVPVVLMEAMATELPVLTTRIAGIPELVEDGITGRLVEPGRPGDVAEALLQLAGDAGERAALGRRARARVLQDFLPAQNARRWLDVTGAHRLPAGGRDGHGKLPAQASVIMRTYNSVATVEAAIASVRAQNVPAEIVVVDSGSTDGTLEVVAALADRVVQIPHESFTYGYSLNVGARAARTEVLAPLSGHATMPHPRFLEIGLAHLAAGAAAACGHSVDGDGRPLTGPLTADHEYVLAHRYWGMTNTASVISATAWRRHAFDEHVVASEDQEWTWRALRDSGPLVVDPQLLISGSHRRSAGVRKYHRRLVREITALAHLRPLRPYGAADAVRDWVRTRPSDPFVTGARRLGRTRAIDVYSRWAAGRVQPSASHPTGPLPEGADGAQQEVGR